MSVDSITIKLPTFWTSSPQAWFAQAEAQFAVRNITSQDTKYYYVVASLDTATANRCLPIISSPPQDDKYNSIKNFLMSAFCKTEEERAMTLLNMTNIGDKKPSELMDEMLSLLGDHKPCFLFKQIFLSQLPDVVRIPLSASETQDYRILAQEADRLLIATASCQTVNVTTSHNQHRQGNRQKQNNTLCFFHQKFGKAARKCVSPCKFSTQYKNQGNDLEDQQ